MDDIDAYDLSDKERIERAVDVIDSLFLTHSYEDTHCKDQESVNAANADMEETFEKIKEILTDYSSRIGESQALIFGLRYRIIKLRLGDFDDKHNHRWETLDKLIELLGH
jgi:hypothetical protein